MGMLSSRLVGSLASTLLGVALATACTPARQASQPTAPTVPALARVAPDLHPSLAVLAPLDDHAQPLAAVRDRSGQASSFVVGDLLIRPRSPADLQSFLTRYGGHVVHDDKLPQLSPEFRVALTDAQRAATEYVVAIDLSRVDVSRFGVLAGRAGWVGNVDFSSDAALRTFIAALDARDRGFMTDANFVYEKYQTFPAAPNALPLTLFSSSERPAPATDAFQEPLYGASAKGSPADVILAWQFLAAHGIQRQVRVAIIDDGYFLSATGQPIGPDSDFLGTPLQIDLVGGTRFVGGPGAGICGTTPCPWHGTGVAAVAVGALNNAQGTAGTGAIVGVPILVKSGKTRSSKYQAIRAAVVAGADVVVMSWGSECDSVACRTSDRQDQPFSDLALQGNRPVFVASAGNGENGIGYEVGAPKFQHPCIQDHVICVGALNTGQPDSIDRIQFSNFGARVDVFAPTNIPVISYPNAKGIVTTQTFGGTSASAPYVAGIAAMMKAISPLLDVDGAAEIMRQTARPGGAGVTRVVDALEAVRRAAQPFPMKNDRREPNSIDSTVTTLATAPQYLEKDLNLDPRDRDRFRFEVPNESTATVSLRYANGLGAVSIFSLVGDGGVCPQPAPIKSGLRPDSTGADFLYRLAGGPHVLETRANSIIGYDLGITFTPAAIDADSFENNDVEAKAKSPYSFEFGSTTATTSLGSIINRIGPRFTIDVTLHHPGDIDFYIVRGVDLGGKKLDLTGTSIVFNRPALTLYGNESNIDLQVFRLKPDNTAGTPVAHLTASACPLDPMVVALDSNAYYLVRVSGSPGHYSLYNGVDTSSRRHAIKQRDRLYEVLHPGQPVEGTIATTQYYVLPADPAFDALLSDDPRVHLRLLDAMGKVMQEGAPSGFGERLSLGRASQDAERLVEVNRRGFVGPPASLHLAWQGGAPVRTSNNLIENGNVETLVTAAEAPIPHWKTRDGVSPALARAYQELGSKRVPGGANMRGGAQLFASAPQADRSGLRQIIAIPAEWREGINAGRVRARLSALLGGAGAGLGAAAVQVSYVDVRQQPLGALALPAVSGRERGGASGFIAASDDDYLPKGTAYLVVDLDLDRGHDRSASAFADDLELVLTEHADPKASHDR